MSYITNDDQTVQYKDIRGERHIKVAHLEWTPVSLATTKVFNGYLKDYDRMDLGKPGSVSKKSSSISETSVPTQKNKAKY